MLVQRVRVCVVIERIIVFPLCRKVPVCYQHPLKKSYIRSCDAVSNAVGLSELTKKLIGFKKMTLREVGNSQKSVPQEITPSPLFSLPCIVTRY